MEFVSEGATALTGWSTAALMQNQPAYGELIVPEDRQRVWDEVQAGLATRQPFVLQYRIRTADGSLRWVWERGRGAFDAADQLVFIEGFIADDTARVEAEQAVRESEQRFRAYVEQAADALFVYDDDGRLLDVNPQACRSLGYSREELLELHLPDFDPAVRLEELRQEWARIGSGPHPAVQSQHRRKDGTRFPVEVHSGGFEVRGRRLHLALARDITERAQAEARSRRLRDLGLAVAGASELPEALRHALEAAMAIAGVEAGGIYVVNEATGSLELVCHAGLPAGFVAEVTELPEGSPNARWARLGSVFHGSVDLLDLPAGSRERRAGFKALSLLPVTRESRLVALLNITSCTVDEVPVAARHSLESVASLVGGILDRTRAQEALRRANAELEQRVEARTRELARSEEQFRVLFETSRDAILTTDETGRILDCNQAAVTLFGVTSKAEFLQGDLRHWSAPRQPGGAELSDLVADVVSQSMRGLNPFFEWVHRRADGTEFTAEVAISQALIDGRQVLQGLVRDISQRKAAENQLRASEARFRQLLELAPLPMGLANDRGELTFLNARHILTFGYSRDELPDLEAWWQRAYPDTAYRRQVRERWDAAVARAVASGADIEPQEYLVTCRDGTVRDIIVSGIQLGPDVLATFLDVTTLRKADAELRKLRRAVEQSPTAVVITDQTGTIEYANPRFEVQTGYPRDEVVGLNPRFLKSGVHPPEFYRELWITLRAGQVWRGELCNRRRDGTLFWESTAIAPVQDNLGRLTHYVAIKEDITERRRIASELQQAKEVAEAANQAKSRFLANMSHEIRTPMNAILGFAQLLQREPNLNPEQHQHLATINRSGEHLLRLINDVLDMSKIEAGRMRLTPVDCDFQALVEDMTAMFRLRTQEKGLEFRVRCDAGVPARLYADAGRIRQVLLNLLGNAVKFTERGWIDLHVTATAAPPAGDSPDAAGARPWVQVSLEVTDTGTGIAPEDLGRVFDPFEQTQAGQRLGGTGLGLAISRQLARLLGGDLTVTSQAGAGSTFRFTWVAPVPETAGAAGLRLAEPPRVRTLHPGNPPATILVVDDTESNRDVLRLLLEEHGFVVHDAADGAEAVAYCRARPPALVLMDRRMPGLDGLEATRQIRAGPAGATPRILIVSANVLGTAEDDWRLAGADGFLGKPVRHDELLARIATLLHLDYVEQPPAPAPGSPAEIRKTAGQLPAGLRADLVKATEGGDVSRLRELIAQQVVPLDPGLGERLGHFVATFDYAALLEALRP
jgi:PAS domain S-box-containing protein